MIGGAILGVVASTFLPFEHVLLRTAAGAVAGTIGGIATTVIAGRLWRERRSGSDA
jgi:hypothetical protein